MSLDHLEWLSTGSTDRPITFTFLRSNSGLILAMYPSSVVHTGVKSRGCENRTAHESPIQSWNLMRPSVVSASKSGAVSPIFSAIGDAPSFPQGVRCNSDMISRLALRAVVGLAAHDLPDSGRSPGGEGLSPQTRRPRLPVRLRRRG